MSVDVSHSLLIDLYEFTMVDAYRRADMAHRPAVFSLFVRSLPPERGYLVAAGLDDALSWLESVRFEQAELAALDRLGMFSDDFLDWLAELRFTGTVRAVPEGTIVFADEPILEVDAPIAEAQLAETFLLNQITLQTVLATKAARCRDAAAGRAVVDFAARRSPGIDAAMKLARICRVVGLDSTSNVAGADRYGVGVSGTMAHSFVEAHRDEAEAFRAFADAFGDQTVLLVDTYDTAAGVEHAIAVATEMRERGIEIRGIRLDSGDLAAHAHDARRRLDQAGFGEVRVFASGGLDEHEIHRLVHSGAPIDGFGVGTALGASDDAPSLDSVYKLVAYDGRPVRKTSPGKATWPGAKQVWRDRAWSGDLLSLVDEPPPDPRYEPLLVEAMVAGARTAPGTRDLTAVNTHFEQSWQRLPAALRDLNDPAKYTVDISDRLVDLTRHLDHPDRP
jgi:nicotinate phosphoribosyltransferase